MANFSFTINETIPNIVVSENQEVVQVQSTSTTVQISQNGVALVGTPGPTGATGPQGPTGATGPQGDTGPAGNYEANPSFTSISFNGNLGNIKAGSTSLNPGYATQFLIDTFADAFSNPTTKYFIQVNDDQDNFIACDITVTKRPNHDIYFSQNGILENQTIGTFSAEWDGGTSTGKLYFTPAYEASIFVVHWQKFTLAV